MAPNCIPQGNHEADTGTSAGATNASPRNPRPGCITYWWLFLLTPIVCSLFTFLVLLARTNGLFEQWRSYGSPPEKPAKILAVTDGLWVLSESDRVYKMDYYTDCSDCWHLSDYPRPDPPAYFRREQCGPSPMLVAAIDMIERCDPWGVGDYLKVYAIAMDGTVFYWGHGRGEGDSLELIAFPFLALPAGFILAFFAVPFAATFFERRRMRSSAKGA